MNKIYVRVLYPLELKKLCRWNILGTWLQGKNRSPTRGRVRIFNAANAFLKWASDTTSSAPRGIYAALASLACACAPMQPTVGVIDLTSRPAEHALLLGLNAYENGHYPEAEKNFQTALTTGLASPKDRSGAHKHLAFIYCTTQRIHECEAAFTAAKNADPSFTLSRSEQGHPAWGPVYRRLLK